MYSRSGSSAVILGWIIVCVVNREEITPPAIALVKSISNICFRRLRYSFVDQNVERFMHIPDIQM